MDPNKYAFFITLYSNKNNNLSKYRLFVIKENKFIKFQYLSIIKLL